MKGVSFNLSTRIEFGNGYVDRAGELVKEQGAQKVMIVTDEGIRRAGITERVEASLKKAKISYVIFDQIMPNPRDIHCVEAGNIAIAEQVNFVLAVGGGSSMDSAKAIACLVTNQGPIANILKPNKVKEKPIPLMCIPTTAGTGSEVTSFAVLTLDAEKKKTCIFDDKIRPDIALLDPQLLKGLPQGIIASTGVDALTHALEAYTCKCASPITDAFALAAIKLIAANLRNMMYQKGDEHAYGMMMGSLLAGLAFGFSDIASVHCLAEAIGGYYDTPHGVANAIFLPVVFEYNIPADVKKHRDAALALGIDPTGKSDREIAQCGAQWIRQLSKDLEIPSLRSLGYVEPDKFDMLAEVCMVNVSTPSNARPVNKEKYIELFQKTYEEG